MASDVMGDVTSGRAGVNETPAPLTGLVVVELGHSVAAPYAGQILGDLGAEVIKIEKPDGDDARKWGPPFVDGAAATFQALNRNKRSVVCELRDAAQRERLAQYIVERADVVLQNLRPGQIEALGLLQPVPGLSVPLIGLPIRFDGERSAPRSGPPRLGEHTQIVLGEVNT